MEMEIKMPSRHLELAVRVACSFLAGNSGNAVSIDGVIREAHKTIIDLDGASKEGGGAVKHLTARQIRMSIGDDFLTCLEDGKKLKMLKRYLRSRYNLTPEEYRAKWGLPADYPMVAPNYAEQRSQFAKKIGLGKNPAGKKVRR